MAKAISNRNVLDAKFDIADFSGKWLEAFGKPELRGAWIIYGGSGSGKTHFALQLLKYLSGFVNRAAYDTLEQGLSLSFQNAWKDVAMQEVGSRVIVLAKEPITELRERLRKRKSPDVVVIDSITALVGIQPGVVHGTDKRVPRQAIHFRCARGQQQAISGNCAACAQVVGGKNPGRGLQGIYHDTISRKQRRGRRRLRNMGTRCAGVLD